MKFVVLCTQAQLGTSHDVPDCLWPEAFTSLPEARSACEEHANSLREKFHENFKWDESQTDPVLSPDSAEEAMSEHILQGFGSGFRYQIFVIDV